MAREVILSKCFGQHIGDLVGSTNREDLDKSFADMLVKMMVAHIDMLGARMKLGKPCKFESS